MPYKHGISVNGRPIDLYTWLDNNKNDIAINQLLDIILWIPLLRKILDEGENESFIYHQYVNKQKIPTKFRDFKGIERNCIVGYWHLGIYTQVVVNPWVRGHSDMPWFLLDEYGYRCSCSLQGVPQLDCKVHHYIFPAHDLSCTCLDDDNYMQSSFGWVDIDAEYPIIVADKPGTKGKKVTRFKLTNLKAKPLEKK